MWGMIATWRMALEGVSKGAEMLGQGGDAGDAVETAVREVEDFPYYKSVGYGGLPNEDMEVEMVRKDRSPFWAALGGEKLEHFLNRRKFEAADSGWYYSQTKKAVLVKYPNPKKDVTLTVSFENFDLIGM